MDTKNHAGKNLMKIREFILCGILILLSFILALNGRHLQPMSVLPRPAAGESAKEVELQVQMGEETWNWKGNVAPQIYSAEEIEKQMEEAEEYLWQHLSPEGEKPDGIYTGVNLITEIPDTAVKVSWEWDEKELLDRNGNAIQEHITEPNVLILNAKLRCQDYQEILQFPIRLLPKEYTQEETKKLTLEETLTSLAEEKEENGTVLLPDFWQGEEVSYGMEESNRYWILPLLGVFYIALRRWQEKDGEEKKKRELREEFERQYPDFVQRFVILLGAGMNLYAVWQKLEEEYADRREKGGKKEALYEEVKITVQALRNGELERKAYEDFGKRIGLGTYQKFVSILTQNLKLGAEQVLEQLDYEVQQAVEKRKAQARKEGEEKETKLLLPMMVQLVLILLIVILPAFLSM